MDGYVAGSWLDEVIVEPVRTLLAQLAAFLPRLLGALLLFLIGWVIAKVLEQLIVKILKAVPIDKLADQVQLTSVLSRGGIKHRLSELIGMIFYWLVMLTVVTVVFNALDLTQAAQLFQSAVTYVPNIIAALLIVIFGMFVASFLGTTVRTAASNAGILQAHLLGQLVQSVVVIFAAVAALRQLQIPFFQEALLIVLAGFSLGAALAFGLGCKDLAGRWTSDLIEEIRGKKR
ncbi:MAG: hypothetical protein COV75_00515 [Candidatus Omnitrophica bacterium CG11_big_fil_rev_8_21_14_0_20_63_9]|nr:MAG: hypothetical protein COV75_00515 [Candidatus Omnitrophica bacterium CG11_big_fil_rev_8_21_14_0_20_63_9]